MPSPSSATGPLRSSNARLAQLVFSCCHAAGLSSERSLGSIATAAWQRISRRQSRAPRRGSISPQRLTENELSDFSRLWHGGCDDTNIEAQHVDRNHSPEVSANGTALRKRSDGCGMGAD